MNRKAKAGLVAFGVGLLVAPLQVATAETTSTPAPPGSSEAVAAQVGDIVKVGYTKATAGPSSGEATANAVELGGKPLSTGTGGTQKTTGKSSGAIFDTKDTPLGRLMLTPWEATVGQKGDTRTTESDSALAKLVLINSGTLRVNVLHTNSKAEHKGMESKGNTSSDGARVVLGGDKGLTVVVLHSETSSEAKGNESYVAGINGTKVLSSGSAGQSCALAVPGVVTLGCLKAAGGKGISTASVADGRLGDPTKGTRIAVVAGQSQFGNGSQVLGTEFSRPEEAAGAVAGGNGPATDFAVTGGDVTYGILVGLALMAMGVAVLSIRKAWLAAS